MKKVSKLEVQKDTGRCLRRTNKKTDTERKSKKKRHRERKSEMNPGGDCFESGGSGKTKRKPKRKMNRKTKRLGVGGGPVVVYDGNLNRPVHPSTMKSLKEDAEFAIDVFNKTDKTRGCPIKYSFVEMKHAYLRAKWVHMVFTAKPKDNAAADDDDDDDDDKNVVTFRAEVNRVNHCVEYVQLQEDQHNKGESSSSVDNKKIKLFEDGRPVLFEEAQAHSSCDDNTRDFLNGCIGLALDYYNKKHDVRYRLVKLVRAAGRLSAGSMVDLMFIADDDDDDDDDDDTNRRTFQAQVDFAHKYVHFVDDFIP